MVIRLNVDDDELAACVSCGLCLPHCPTFRVSGEESRSPRGRIAAMRAVQWEGAEPDDDFVRFMNECIQCRGCEPACPSAVPFGRLMEGARESMAVSVRPPPPWLRWGLAALGRHRFLLAGSSALAVAQRLRLVPPRLSRRLGLPARLPVRRAPLPETGTDVWLYPGCVMDAWQRDVHADTVAVLAAVGVGVQLPAGAPEWGCCGALHSHAGLTDRARRMARRVMAAMPGDAPVLVNAAGCGAAMKDYGHLLGTPEAAAFSARVRDVHEVVAQRVDRLPDRAKLPFAVAVQDPCHLRHVQRAHGAVRTVLSRYADLVELDDEGLCCGAGGAYAALQPELSGQVRERKVAAIDRAGAPVVASANPGCALHLQGAGVDARHPLTLVAQALASRPHGR